jgi:dsDNA-specific endonuclease/ATPase MutS2
MEHDFPGGEYPDVDYIVAKLRVEGSFLDVEEVVTLRRALAAIGGIVSFIISREERYPALHARTRGVAAFPEIVQRIDGILDRFGQVKDNASPCRRSAAPSANAKGRRPSGCRPCCLRPRGRASSMPTPRSRSATARP